MIPYSYNMVDMGGIDLAEANGTVVEGLYNRLALARNACGDLILYNWKFVGIEIAPSVCSTIDAGTSIIINGMIEVTDEDVVSIPSLLPPSPVLISITIDENGQYSPLDYDADGFSDVTVNVTGTGDDWTSLKNYIESNGTQYINTGYSVKDNSKFEVIANPSTTQPQYGTIFGTRSLNDDYASSKSCILATAWSSNLGNVNWGSYINRLTSLDKGNKTKYVVVKTHAVAMISESIEGVIGFTQINSTQSATTASLMIFTLGINGADYGSVTHCNMKLYRFRIYEGDTLIHEYLPWQENGVVCLKDTVTSNLLYNSGTGDFIYGTDT